MNEQTHKMDNKTLFWIVLFKYPLVYVKKNHWRIEELSRWAHGKIQDVNPTEFEHVL